MAAAELAGTVDWRRELAGVIRRAMAVVGGRVDYTFTRRSRRTAATPGVILPGLGQPVPEVAVVCDTSSSMSTDDLAVACAEIEAITAGIGCRQRGITVLAVDADVHSIARVRRAGDVVLRGGGGTDMGVGLAAVIQCRPRPHVVVVLTDGWTPWPASAPAGVNVVVGLVGDDAAPSSSVPAWARAVQIPGPRS